MMEIGVVFTILNKYIKEFESNILYKLEIDRNNNESIISKLQIVSYKRVSKTLSIIGFLNGFIHNLNYI